MPCDDRLLQLQGKLVCSVPRADARLSMPRRAAGIRSTARLSMRARSPTSRCCAWAGTSRTRATWPRCCWTAPRSWCWTSGAARPVVPALHFHAMQGRVMRTYAPCLSVSAPSAPCSAHEPPGAASPATRSGRRLSSQACAPRTRRFPTLPVAELQRHTAPVNTLAWAPHSSCHICTAGDDAQALIWDLSSMSQPLDQDLGATGLLLCGWRGRSMLSLPCFDLDVPTRTGALGRHPSCPSGSCNRRSVRGWTACFLVPSQKQGAGEEKRVCWADADPILAYSAGAEVNQLQWSTTQPDWVAICFANKTQARAHAGSATHLCTLCSLCQAPSLACHCAQVKSDATRATNLCCSCKHRGPASAPGLKHYQGVFKRPTVVQY